ncbi:argonaute/piwi family protein [Nocardia gipuzkoensis]
MIVCRPDNLNDAALSKAPKNTEIEVDGSYLNGRNPVTADFHALLKARSLRYKQPIQIVRRNTWDPTFKNPHTGRVGANQDEATRAWNLYTGLYYKNGGVPWRLPRDPSDLSSCYIGIAFYKSAASTLHTSVAQIYNQRGDGIIVRGGPATISKEDRQPHLAEEDAQDLLEAALQRYRAEHLHAPARIVLHKASNYTAAERAGFTQAANNERLALLEMLWLTNSETIRLYRNGQQPPLRGTFLTVDEDRHLLYTTGAIPFYKTYPGHHIPQPLGIRIISADSSPDALATEILALTKMNWNNTRLDGSIPITLRTARTVGTILRHHDTDAPTSGRYAHYM